MCLYAGLMQVRYLRLSAEAIVVTSLIEYLARNGIASMSVS